MKKELSEELEAARKRLPAGCLVRVKDTGIVTKTAIDVQCDADGTIYVEDLFGYPYAVRECDLERVSPEEFVCQRCSSSRLLLAGFEALPGFDSIPASVYLRGQEGEVPISSLPFVAPHALNPQNARSIGLVICADCGQMQGQWPLEGDLR